MSEKNSAKISVQNIGGASPDPELSRKRSSQGLFGKSDTDLDFSQNTKEKSENGENPEEILSKDTDTNDDMTRLEERESLSPSLPHRQTRQMSKTASLSECDLGPSIAQDRKRRVSKKPTNDYEEKFKEEKEKTQRQRVVAKKPKVHKADSKMEDNKMEIERPQAKHEIGYEWKDLQLAFRNALSTLSHEEFVKFIKIVQVEKPDAVSFEKGYLELKISGTRGCPGVSENEHTKTNQMQIQNQIFSEFLEYIGKIKGSDQIGKFRGKKITKGNK